MCGIIGWFGDRQASQSSLGMAVRALAHRGPDAQVAMNEDKFSFGHSLLSIIGDSPIRQPIVSRDGHVSLTYNGEIYNYVELLEEFSDLRSRCQHHSDTEMLVEGLSLFGIDFVNKLNGIFAFACFDHRTHKGYLVRDRLGVKPLYHTTAGGSLFFCSEVKPLIDISGISEELDVEGIYSYTRFRYPLGNRTIYRQAKMLLPGNWLEIDGKQSTTHCYWDIEIPVQFKGSYEDACDSTRSLLGNAIEIQMRSDHSFCTYLSGGLDSSFLTAVARNTKDVLDTYSIEFEDAVFDESPFSREVARELSTRHHPYLLTRDEYRDEHVKFVEHQKNPCSVPNQVALKVLSRELSKDHRCVLSGEGADEVFGGYGRIFLLPYDWQRLEAAKNRQGAAASSFLDRIRRRHGRTEFADYADFFIDRYGYVSHEQATQVLNRYFQADAIAQACDSIEEDFRTQFRKWDTDAVTRQLLVFQKLHLPGLLLRVDSSTMSHSVEGRVPFLDHRLLNLLNSMPIEYKMKRKSTFDGALQEGLLSDELSEIHDVPKSILKDISGELLPNKVIWRKKIGFPIPSDFYDLRTDSEGSSSGDKMPKYSSWIVRNLDLLFK